MIVSPTGEALIKGFEGCAKAIGGGKFEAYPDPGTGDAPWSIGYGSTGPDIHKGLVWTQEQCDQRFDRDIQQFAAHVLEMLRGAKTSQNQFDALVSFQYNTGRLSGSTLLSKHRTGDYKGAAIEFSKWNHADGRVMSGLTRRRAAEAALYAKG